MELLFIIAVMAAFFWLIIVRPQKQQQRRHQQLLDGLKPGDEVITNGGIYGDVVEVQTDRISLEIAEDVEIEVAKRAIATVVPPEEHEATTVEEPEPVAEEEPAGR